MRSWDDRHRYKSAGLSNNSQKQRKIINELPFAQIEKQLAQETPNHPWREAHKGMGMQMGKE